MKAKAKILAVGNRMPIEDASRFLQSTGLWDVMSLEDKEAFLMRGEVLDTDGGNKLGIVLAKRSAEDFLIQKHSPSNN